MNREKEWRKIHHDAQREIGNRADAIYRQPWRIWRNRRLRGEIRAIMAVVDPQDAPLPGVACPQLPLHVACPHGGD